MGENFNINGTQYEKKNPIIMELLKGGAPGLETALATISDMDEPHALHKIEETIVDKRYDFKSLETAFEKIKYSWQEQHKNELIRRTIISFLRRPDCPKHFIEKYAKEAFPETISGN